ncbi:hypothetical protein DE146DRAFT_635767 [Phaeosphaeria sp. MPI-PUGE-AT-0046c]|nr:hypothetical protein DE146DRAFT_635767 [Phaeosphaeria sp. MPI-PUGE-AT-0046c]
MVNTDALWDEKRHDNSIRVDTAISIDCSDRMLLRSNRIQSVQGRWSLTIITISLALGTFLVALDTMIIGIAVPSIISEFKPLDKIAWYAGSTVCGAAKSAYVFIFGRALAGCGAAGLFQGALNIITATVPLAKRPLFLSAVISVFGISICIGPVIGGAFTQNIIGDGVSGCMIFVEFLTPHSLIGLSRNLPISFVTFVQILMFLEIKNKRAPMTLKARVMQLDPLGAILLLTSVVCLLLALQWGGQAHPWKSATIIGLLVGSGLLFILFGFMQWKMGENATIPLRVLKQRSILFTSSFLFFIAMSNYVVPYMVLGSIACAIGSGLLTTIDTTSPTIEWATYMVVIGIGMGICVNLPYTAVQVVLDEADVPTGNAIAQFSFQLGA